jgi:flagellar basal-body rod modification protein FlgD
MPIPAILMSVAGGLLSGLAQKALSSSSEAVSASSSTLGKDDFLRLLTTQLSNQDPLNPMSSTDFVAQTAQFTSLEQLQNMNSTMQQLVTQLGGSGFASAAPLLGRTVSVNGSPISLEAGQTASLAYQLPTSASSVYLQVQDASGNAVRTLSLGQQDGGIHQVTFDGLDDAGKPLPSGSYIYKVVAADGAGQPLSNVITGAGQVSGINMENGQLVLQIGNARVPLASVVGVMAGTM